MKKFLTLFGVLFAICATSGMMSSGVSADSRPTFNVVIEPGLLAAAVRGQDGGRLESPVIYLNEKTSTYCSGSIKTGMLGTESERLYMENPDATTDGWSLSLAAKQPSPDLDQSIADVVDPCVSATKGAVIIDPTKALLNTDCLRCSTNNIAIGSRQNFVDTGVPVTILQSGQKSEDIGRWYVTGINVESYQVDSGISESGLVLTAAAI